jgi:hypothetical protein
MPQDDIVLRLLTELNCKTDDRHELQTARHIEVTKALSTLTTQMENLVNGTDTGRIQKLEKRVNILMKFHYKALGAAAVLSSLITLVVQHFWKK